MTESDWPKADPVTTPKVDFTMEAWQRLAMERGDEIARLGELVKILEARNAHLEKMASPMSHTVRPEIDLTEDDE